MAIFYNTAGNDKFTGTGNDTVSYSTALAGVTVNLSQKTAQDTKSGLDILSGINNILGSDYFDSLTGNDLDNFIYGGMGNDLMVGGSGNDTLDGGNGNDTVSGNDGDDLLFGGIGNDTLSGGLADDSVYGGTGSDKITGEDGNDVLSGEDGNDKVLGGSGNDTLAGGSGNDILDGGLGIDSLTGGTGNDTYEVNSVNDVVIETSILGSEIDTINSSVSWNLATQGLNIENLTLTGAIAINGLGNDLNNKITGNVAANILEGGIGNDTLIGGAGNDKLTGGAGRDLISGGAGADVFIFVSPNDSAANTDVIPDFSSKDGDKINLHGIFAGKVTFLGTGAFTGGANAEVNYATSASGVTIIRGDVDHNGAADFAIQLNGVSSLATTDFIF